jgi:hypothetical protein
MKRIFLGAAMLALLAPPAFAQSPGAQDRFARQQDSGSSQNLATAQKLQQDLQNAGFTDVKVVAESYVVQAKTKDGDPVLMTIGPHGMSLFEAMEVNGAGPDRNSTTTGSAGNSSGSSSTSGSAGNSQGGSSQDTAPRR